MKRVLLLISVVALVIGVSGVAFAVSYVDSQIYTDTYQVGEQMQGYLWSCDTISWTFDISDDGAGYNPTTQDIIFASVRLNFQDSDRFWREIEMAQLEIGSNTFFWEVDSGDVNFTLESIMTLSNSGIVDASVTAVLGDFYFNEATLTAEAITSSSTQPVPEPATMLLLGTGLVSLAGVTRKKIFKNC